MKTQDYDSFEDLLEWLVKGPGAMHRLSVVRVSDDTCENIIRKGECCYFLRSVVTVYDHNTDTIHRWREKKPNVRTARNVFKGLCEETLHRNIREKLMLMGYFPASGSWTPAFIEQLRNG